MRPSPNHLDRSAEIERIFTHYGPDAFAEIMTMLERQFAVLHNRAQVTLALSGIIVTTTGFSGRNIAGTGPWAQALIVAGAGLVLISAAVVCWGVLHLRWLTMQPGQDVRQWLEATLRYRDRKTMFYRVGLLLLLLGFTGYVAAIAIMLLHPHDAPKYLPR